MKIVAYRLYGIVPYDFIWNPIKGYAIVENRFLEITLSYEGINTWVAFGLSPTGSMPDTDIYYCQNRENQIGVESAYASSRCKFYS